jgi:hypothetical protein
MLMPVSEAWADCSPTTSVATPGSTVTCIGNTTNQNVRDGYGTGSESNLLIIVKPGASVSGNEHGINVFFGTNDTINNSGTIRGGELSAIVGGANIINDGDIEGGHWRWRHLCRNHQYRQSRHH